MKYTDKLIHIERIEPNPLRDFDIYPIHQDKIEKLEASYADGDFGTIIPVRQHPTKQFYYQQACGHHRIAAMQSEGNALEILCRVQDLSDEEMVSIMVRENMNNYGNNPEAVADSVAAICNVLIYRMFLSDSYANFSQICEKYTNVFSDNRAFDSAKGRLIASNQIGEPLVTNFFGPATADCPMNEAQIKNGLASLNATGKMQEICALQRNRAESKLEANKNAEIKRAKVAKQKAKEAQEAQDKWDAAEIIRKAKRKEELAAVKAMKDELARKQEEARLAREKTRADRERKRIKALEEERQKEIKIEESANEKRAAIEAAQEKATKARKNAEDKTFEPWLHPAAFGMFANADQFNMFRSTLGGHDGRFKKLFPVDQQPAIIEAMIESLKIEDNMTARGVKEWMIEQDKQYKAVIDAKNKAILAENQRLMEKGNNRRKADRIVKGVCATLGQLGDAYQEMEDASKNDPELWDAIASHQGTTTIRATLDHVERRISFLRKQFNVDSTTFRPTNTNHNEEKLIEGVK